MSHRINHSQRAKHLSAGIDQFRREGVISTGH